MHSFSIPPSGLNLGRSTPDPASSDSNSKGLLASQSHPLQAFRLELNQSSFNSLISVLRKDPSAARLRLGKRPTIHFSDNKTAPQPLNLAAEEHRSELYVVENHKNTDAASRQQQQHHHQQQPKAAYLSAIVSHKLEDPTRPTPSDTIATVDTALADLVRKLSDIGRDKGSRETTQLDSVGDLKSLKRQQQQQRNRQGVQGRSNTSSIPPRDKSPSPVFAPNEIDNKESARLAALRQPFLHLLATRPMSPDFLAKQTSSSLTILKPLVIKYTRVASLDPDKVQLKDQAYRDLNIWGFPYPSENERKDAIENAISAFDRMRVSKTDKIWQMLLPREERGKGKVLSRLNLSVRPPPVVGAVKKHAPKRPASSAANESEGSAKKRMTNSNTTLTGRVTKKMAGEATKKKTSTPESKKSGVNSSKYKSSEIIMDSDEELEKGEIASSPRLHDGPNTDRGKSSSPVLPKNTRLSIEKTTDRPMSSNGHRPISRSPSLLARPASSHSFSAHHPPDSRSSSASSSSTMKFSRNVSSTTAATSVANSYSPRPSALGSSPLANTSGYEDRKTDVRKKTPSSTMSRIPTAAKSTPSGARIPSSKLHNSISPPATNARPVKRKIYQSAEPDKERPRSHPSKRPVQRPISNASSTGTNSSSSNAGLFRSNESLRKSRLSEITSDSHSSPSPPPQLPPSHRAKPSSLAASKARNAPLPKQPDTHSLAQRRVVENARAFKERYPVYKRLHAALATSASRNATGRPSDPLIEKFRKEDEGLRSIKRKIAEDCERLPKKKQKVAH